MPLNKTKLKSDIKSLLQDMMKKEKDATDEFADKLATIIDTYVKGATITVAAGIPVSTAGTAVAQTGATTGPGTATIS